MSVFTFINLNPMILLSFQGLTNLRKIAMGAKHGDFLLIL